MSHSSVNELTAAMVTSTSTPGSREMEVICLTTSAEEVKSINRLWILISYRSQVLEPSPQGLVSSVQVRQRVLERTSTYVFRVVCLRTLVGSRTGPLTLRSRSLARLMRSPQTGLSVCNLTTNVKFHIHFSKGLTFLEVRVILILWVLAPPCAPDLSRSSLNSAILIMSWLV